jgi:hypothetical protein
LGGSGAYFELDLLEHQLKSTTSTMADYERTVLDHYGLSTAYPLEWPAEKDNSDASDEEDRGGKAARNGKMRRSKSRYSALERAASDRKSYLPGAQRTDNGVENMVQRDEPDPLGTTDSVVRILRQLNIPVQDDLAMREFAINSNTISPTDKFRQQIPAFIYNFLTRLVPFPGPLNRLYADPSDWPGNPVTVH